MNTLSNGAVAVGTEGSWMRLQSAYEHELEKINETGMLLLRDGETVANRAETMLKAVMLGNGNLGPSLQRAAKACGIKPTYTAIRPYLRATNYIPL